MGAKKKREVVMNVEGAGTEDSENGEAQPGSSEAQTDHTQVGLRIPKEIFGLIAREKQRILTETGYSVHMSDIVLTCVRKQLA